MPVSSVNASASAFICATINSMPSPASVTTTVTRPDASKRGERTVPSSNAFLSDGAFGNSSADIAGQSFFLTMILSENRSPLFGTIVGRPAARSAAGANHGHEAHLFLGRVLEDAGEGRGQRGRALLADTAHGHAHV